MAREQSIAVTLNAPEMPVWVRGDPQRLRQVLFMGGTQNSEKIVR